MNFHILTLFPDMVERGLNTSIIGRAVGKGLLNIETINIRDYTLDRHKKVDDYPYGGGAGMVMQAQPIYDAWQAEQYILHLRAIRFSRKWQRIMRRKKTWYCFVGIMRASMNVC